MLLLLVVVVVVAAVVVVVVVSVVVVVVVVVVVDQIEDVPLPVGPGAQGACRPQADRLFYVCCWLFVVFLFRFCLVYQLFVTLSISMTSIIIITIMFIIVLYCCMRCCLASYHLCFRRPQVDAELERHPADEGVLLGRVQLGTAQTGTALFPFMNLDGPWKYHFSTPPHNQPRVHA